ncbi:MAG: hypothetical protein E6G81_11925 [Alphaproteobacteria bacterium]|nr:MAG: hypothetical protein E6G81_11925 [Alphaproteobacteria bacterium]
MRSGAEYREALRDGRKVWVMGGGAVDDVTTHPATRAMIDEYVAWYDRHRDPEWQDILLVPAEDGDRQPWAFFLPRRNRTRRLDLRPDAECLARADRQCACLPRDDRPHRPLHHLLRRRADHRPAHAAGPRRPRRAEAGARDRRRRYHSRPARHAYEPGLCRRRLCRRHVGHRYRRQAGRVYHAGRRARRHDIVPQAGDARDQPVHRTLVAAL